MKFRSERESEQQRIRFAHKFNFNWIN